MGGGRPKARGPVIGSVQNPAKRNVIGTHSGSYSIYRALAVASGQLDADHVPDLTDTTPIVPLGPHPQWHDLDKIVALDPFGHLIGEVFADELKSGLDIRPTIAVTRARLHLPEFQMAVKEGRCAQATRMEYCTRLSESINDSVAYECFKLCMQMDISEFKPQALYETDLHRGQQSQHECALKAFLEAAQSGEYAFAEYGVAMPDVSGKPGWRYLTSLQLLEHFRRYLEKSGLCSSIDNIKSLGWAVKKYPELIARLDEGRYMKYAVRRAPITL